MIFLTVGSQLPFDRLVGALDDTVPALAEPAFGQIGKTARMPVNFEAVRFLKPAEFQERFHEARVIVGHCGIGTILTAMQLGKPMVLMARRADLGEHRNDHQVSTMKHLGTLQGITIVENKDELRAALMAPYLPKPDSATSASRDNLVDYLRQEIVQIEQNKARPQARFWM